MTLVYKEKSLNWHIDNRMINAINAIMWLTVEHCVDHKVFAVLLGNGDEDIFGESFLAEMLIGT